jgi:hypothetical protein
MTAPATPIYGPEPRRTNRNVVWSYWVPGVSVTVASVDLTDSNQIVAMCRRDGLVQAIPILDLPLPAGAEWIKAYGRWHG